MKKYLLALIVVLTTNITANAQEHLYCSPYVTAPCYRDFYYPGMYRQDIGFACAQQISYYQTTLLELDKAKLAFYKTEPTIYQKEINKYDRRIRQLNKQLGSLKARRDALIIRGNNLGGVISEATNQGYLFGNAKFGKTTLKTYTLRFQATQARLERIGLQITALESELAALTSSKNQFISNRSVYVMASQQQLSAMISNYINAKSILQECIYIVLQSAYN